MRQWLEAGYFKGDLPISQISSGPFHPLSVWFPDLNFAFNAQTSDRIGAHTEAELRAAAEVAEKERQWHEASAERESREAEEAEHQRKARESALAAQKEAEQREATRREFDRQRQAKSEEVKGVTNGGNEPSTQLKMILGLPSGDRGDSENQADERESLQPAKNYRGADKRSTKATAKKTPQNSTEESHPSPPVDDNVQAGALGPVAPAWGGAAKAKPKKSMSEIQQEEARAAAFQAAKRGSLPQVNSGWANVAAGTSGWSSGTLRPTSASSSTPGSATIALARPNPSLPQGAANKKIAPITQQRASSAASSTPAEEFGASMSPGLEKWCKEKMYQINGSEDLTLVAFCMTLNDSNEIRQYLTTYLGNTAQVNSFATEFVNKRGLGGKQEEWETPGSAKKGRKKKAGR